MLQTTQALNPEQSQIVFILQKRWVLNYGVISTLESDPLQKLQYSPLHHITLNSIEDDALGETLQVISGLEPGTSILKQVSLAVLKGFDSLQRLDAIRYR